MPSATPSSAPSPTSRQSTTSKSGIVTAENGERHIPASTRADGSVRKEIRVKPGYRPPEDVEVYKNRTAEAWKNRGKSAGVPGADFVDGSPSKPRSSNSKPKQASSSASTARSKQTAAAPEKDGVKEQQVASAAAAAAAANTQEEKEEAEDPETVKEKEARKLSKKLRQARDLQQKKENGDSLLPEQFEKMIRINELIRQLDSLGFDADGQKKEKS